MFIQRFILNVARFFSSLISAVFFFVTLILFTFLFDYNSIKMQFIILYEINVLVKKNNNIFPVSVDSIPLPVSIFGTDQHPSMFSSSLTPLDGVLECNWFWAEFFRVLAVSDCSGKLFALLTDGNLFKWVECCSCSRGQPPIADTWQWKCQCKCKSKCTSEKIEDNRDLSHKSVSELENCEIYTISWRQQLSIRKFWSKENFHEFAKSIEKGEDFYVPVNFFFGSFQRKSIKCTF